MTESQAIIVAASIAAVPAMAAVIVAFLNRKAIVDLRVHINGKMDAFLKLKGEAEYAKGVKSEVDKAVIFDAGKASQ